MANHGLPASHTTRSAGPRHVHHARTRGAAEAQVMMAAASAPGKVILFGEHFVVYGAPAIVSAIDLRAKATVSRADSGEMLLGGRKVEGHPAVRAAEHVLKNCGLNWGVSIVIDSEIPPRVGLGSSASVSVATAASASILALGKIDLDLVGAAALEGERLVHVNPSGIDTSIALSGGSGLYRRYRGLSKIDVPIQRLLIIDTGKSRRTGDMVRRVREYAEKNKKRFEELLAAEEVLVEEVLDMFRSGDIEGVGRMMLRNQELLREIGVSSDEIEEAIRIVMREGAYGAKLTGAGGGGCVICLADERKLGEIADAASKSFKVMTARLSAEGVREEKT